MREGERTKEIEKKREEETETEKERERERGQSNSQIASWSKSVHQTKHGRRRNKYVGSAAE